MLTELQTLFCTMYFKFLVQHFFLLNYVDNCVLDDCKFKVSLLWLNMLQGRYSQYEAYEDEFMTRKLQNMSIYGGHSGRATSKNHYLYFNLYLVIAYL
jgi:hypothetical protein